MTRPKSSKAVVPEVLGLHVDNAVIMLRNVGFSRHRILYTEGYEAEDTVISQQPMRGQFARLNDDIVLRVSKPSVGRFLPAIYQTQSSANDPDFLRRFLFIFQHLHEGIGNRISQVNRNFDLREADADVLPWLAHWVAFPMDLDWSPTQRRKMLRSAGDLYKIRGTKTSLLKMMEVFTGVRPSIEENAWPYKGFRIGVTSRISIDTVILPAMNLAHCFIVDFPKSYEDLGETIVHKIHEIIHIEKPAHTAYYVRFAPPKQAGLTDTAAGVVMPIAGASTPPASMDQGGLSPDHLRESTPTQSSAGDGLSWPMPSRDGVDGPSLEVPEGKEAAGLWPGIGVEASTATPVEGDHALEGAQIESVSVGHAATSQEEESHSVTADPSVGMDSQKSANVTMDAGISSDSEKNNVAIEGKSGESEEIKEQLVEISGSGADSSGGQDGSYKDESPKQ